MRGKKKLRTNSVGEHGGGRSANQTLFDGGRECVKGCKNGSQMSDVHKERGRDVFHPPRLDKVMDKWQGRQNKILHMG